MIQVLKQAYWCFTAIVVLPLIAGYCVGWIVGVFYIPYRLIRFLLTK